jgi:hypothetical protein
VTEPFADKYSFGFGKDFIAPRRRRAFAMKAEGFA